MLSPWGKMELHAPCPGWSNGSGMIIPVPIAMLMANVGMWYAGIIEPASINVSRGIAGDIGASICGISGKCGRVSAGASSRAGRPRLLKLVARRHLTRGWQSMASKAHAGEAMPHRNLNRRQRRRQVRQMRAERLVRLWACIFIVALNRARRAVLRQQKRSDGSGVDLFLQHLSFGALAQRGRHFFWCKQKQYSDGVSAYRAGK